MKLYVINATPVREERSNENNALLIMGYPKVVADILARHGYDGFTIYQVNGYWKGTAEISFKIEIAVPDGAVGEVIEIAQELRDKYNQDSVMVTYPDGEVEFI